MELNKAEYTILAQVKIRLKQFHMETVTNEDDTTKDVAVFDNKEDDLLIEQLIKQAISTSLLCILQVIKILPGPDS